MKRGILVYNPTAGQWDRRAAMSALIDRQRRRGLELVNAPTSGPGDATDIVRSFVSRGIDVVAVCGGDGTISEAVCGLEGSSVPLAVLPGGTGILPTALSQFLRYEFPRLEVTVDGDVHQATFAVACRARHYAGRWIIAPEARLDADHFDVLIFPHENRRKLAQLFKLMAAGRAGHLKDGLAHIVRGRTVAIRSLDGPVEIQVDGDCVL